MEELLALEDDLDYYRSELEKAKRRAVGLAIEAKELKGGLTRAETRN